MYLMFVCFCFFVYSVLQKNLLSVCTCSPRSHRACSSAAACDPVQKLLSGALLTLRPHRHILFVFLFFKVLLQPDSQRDDSVHHPRHQPASSIRYGETKERKKGGGVPECVIGAFTPLTLTFFLSLHLQVSHPTIWMLV